MKNIAHVENEKREIEIDAYWVKTKLHWKARRIVFVL